MDLFLVHFHCYLDKGHLEVHLDLEEDLLERKWVVKWVVLQEVLLLLPSYNN